MKKMLIALTIVISCLGISRVSAEDLQLELYGYDDFVKFKSFFGDDKFNEAINDIISEYSNNYYLSYPYFDIILNNTEPYTLTLHYYKEIPSSVWRFSYSGGIGYTGVYLQIHHNDIYSSLPDSDFLQRTYYLEDGILKYDNTTYSYSITTLINTRDGRNVPSYDTEGAYYRYIPYSYYYSNYDLILSPLSEYKNKYMSGGGYYSNAYIYNYDNLLIPKLDNSNLSSVVSYDIDNYILEPYYLYDTDVDINSPSVTEINLNDYAYVALALKDYNQEPFSTQVQVKGNYCLTPVYNYGMTERKDILTGSQVERCSPYYNNYTPVRTYITESDLKNNSIYYLKAYDTSKENYIKVDNNIFDITYITEENKDKPYVTIDGKTYPTIPYDNLTDTSTKSEDEGYVSGKSENFVDIMINDFTDLFTAPLDVLKDIWESIKSVFSLVKELLSLLPEPMPTFLIISFTLAIILGLIKIIL